MKGRVHRVHLVGIGGAGMSGIAEVLAQTGYAVSGSDVRESAVTRRLRAAGIPVAIGHDARHVADADVVVYSAAVPAGNAEIREAEARGIPAIPRAEMLAELMRLREGVAVAGSHGKTTTTSLVGAVLQAGGLDPTIIAGGVLRSLGSGARYGRGDVLVAEADESDGSFLRLVPTVAVVTNVDREHLDHYGSFEALLAAFRDFADRVPFYGASVLCLDDPHARSLLPELRRRTRTYGLSAQAEVSAEGVELEGLGSRFRVTHGGRPLGPVALRLPGEHNVRNALAAVSVGLELGVAFERIREGLEGFAGVRRRFEVRGERDGVTVVDDYAHHPAEIRASLAAARRGLGRRLVVVFQPHRYTRTRDLHAELAAAFHDADVLLLTEIYAAGEPKIPGVEASALAEAARACGHRDVVFVRDRAELLGAVRARVRPGDLLVFMGAGDVGRLADAFLAGADADAEGGTHD